MKDRELLDGVKAVIDRHRDSTVRAVSQMASAIVEMEGRIKAMESDRANAAPIV